MSRLAKLSPYILAAPLAVNMNTATPTGLYTVPSGLNAIITHIVPHNPSVNLTTVSFSIGFNSAAFNNVLADATHTELASAGIYSVLTAKVGATRGVAGDVLTCLCNVLQGAPATLDFFILGFLF